MPMPVPPLRLARLDTCNDQVVGAILSGWRYDISGISPELRGDYETHLRTCSHCRRRQRIHRTVDVLLLAATTLSFSAFLLAALVMHRIEAVSHISNSLLTVHLHGEALRNEGIAAHIPRSITITLEAVACVGVFVSMLLWVLVAIATPIPAMVRDVFRSRRSSDLHKQAA
jgi:hypothetical protein